MILEINKSACNPLHFKTLEEILLFSQILSEKYNNAIELLEILKNSFQLIFNLQNRFVTKITFDLSEALDINHLISPDVISFLNSNFGENKISIHDAIANWGLKKGQKLF